MAKKKTEAEPEELKREIGVLERTIVSNHCNAVLGEFEDAIHAARIQVELALAPLFNLARKYDVNIDSQTVRELDRGLEVNVRFQVNPENIKKHEQWKAIQNLLNGVRK